MEAVFDFEEPQIHYTKGYKYQLKNTCIVTIPALKAYEGVYCRFIAIGRGGRVVIRAGYAWDGASGPTIDTLTSMRCSLVHDALYQLIRMGLIHETFKGLADELLCKIGIHDDMWKVRAHLWHKMVEEFGGSRAEKGNTRPIISAPYIKGLTYEFA
jgi:hypothetical protein